VSGGIFFQEFNSFDLSQWLGFWFGIVVMFSGLVLLTPQPEESKADDDELHRAFVNLLLESRSADSTTSVVRTPRPPLATLHRSPDPSIGDSVLARGLSVDEGDEHRGRSPQVSKENFKNVACDALDAVKDVFSGDLSAITSSVAMLQNTIDEGQWRLRRRTLEKLLGLIKDNPVSSAGYSKEIKSLIEELELDVQFTPAPSPDIRDVAKHLSMTEEKLRRTILFEIEQHGSPCSRSTEDRVCC